MVRKKVSSIISKVERQFAYEQRFFLLVQLITHALTKDENDYVTCDYYSNKDS